MEPGIHKFGPSDRVRFKVRSGPEGIFRVLGEVPEAQFQPPSYYLERVSDGFKTPCPFDQEDELEKVEGAFA